MLLSEHTTILSLCFEVKSILIGTCCDLQDRERSWGIILHGYFSGLSLNASSEPLSVSKADMEKSVQTYTVNAEMPHLF